MTRAISLILLVIFCQSHSLPLQAQMAAPDSVCAEPRQANKNLRLFEAIGSAEALTEKLNQIKKAISEGAAVNCPFPRAVDQNHYEIQSHFDVPLYRATDPEINPEVF